MTDAKRYVIQARLLGLDNATNKRGKETEYAIEVVLSDESQYTSFRSLKEIANFHTKMMNTFKVEAGYFKKDERVIPDCPIKQTIFGPQRTIRDDKSFGRLLNHYIKEIPGLPAAIVKSDLVVNFFSLKASDLNSPDSGGSKQTKKKKPKKIELTDNSEITGPISLKSYSTIADFVDKKTKFSFKQSETVQVIQKDPSGWWMVDARGIIGWAPASFLVPISENDIQEEEEENQQLIEQERVGTRYISISAYQASRDDELSFVKGAIVKLMRKYVDGWWLVRYNGGEGFVPGALFRKFDKRQGTVYVSKIQRKFTSRGTTRIVPSVKPSWMESHYQPRKTFKNIKAASAGSKSVPLKATKSTEVTRATEVTRTVEAHANHDKPADSALVEPEKKTESNAPTNIDNDMGPIKYLCVELFEENGIRIHKDEKIGVLDDTESDWWYVEDLQGNKGWAPASYFQSIMDRVEEGEEEEEISFGVDTDSNNSSYESDEDDMDLDSDSMDIEDCYVVVKDYQKIATDELDMTEGQVVCVIDDSDSDMWYVNADGKEGWVPSNILRLLTEEEMQSSDGESTPTDARSIEVSADNSEISDSEELRAAVIKRRSQQTNPDGSLGPVPRPRSQVICKSSSPVPNRKAPVNHSDESDSDAVNTNSHMQNVTILVGDKSLEELEKEAEDANKLAAEAKRKAKLLQERLQLAKMQKEKV